MKASNSTPLIVSSLDCHKKSKKDVHLFMCLLINWLINKLINNYFIYLLCHTLMHNIYKENHLKIKYV